jgi:hypothetical protein
MMMKDDVIFGGVSESFDSVDWLEKSKRCSTFVFIRNFSKFTRKTQLPTIFREKFEEYSQNCNRRTFATPLAHWKQ